MIMGKHHPLSAPTLELDFTPSTEPGMGKLILGPVLEMENHHFNWVNMKNS
jgi:hypothetical protein